MASCACMGDGCWTLQGYMLTKSCMSARHSLTGQLGRSRAVVERWAKDLFAVNVYGRQSLHWALLDMNHQYPQGGDYQNAFWRTLCGDVLFSTSAERNLDKPMNY